MFLQWMKNDQGLGNKKESNFWKTALEIWLKYVLQGFKLHFREKSLFDIFENRLEIHCRNMQKSLIKSGFFGDIFFIHLRWLGNRDSNPNKQSQSLSCYRYTIPQSFLFSLTNSNHYTMRNGKSQVFFEKNSKNFLYSYI